jgi:thiamine-phosphate pyrophosphorylase
LRALVCPIVCLITTGEATAENYHKKKIEILRLIEAASEIGIGMIQLREKALSPRLLVDLVSAAAKITAEKETLLLVNGRADIAAVTGADGVHLPADSLSVRVVRKSFPDLLIGVSTHSLHEAEAAAAGDADYVFFGPVFDTPGKGQPKGLDELAEVCRKLRPFPVIALGGIDEMNFPKAIAAGSSGIAAIRFLNDTANLYELRDHFQDADRRCA